MNGQVQDFSSSPPDLPPPPPPPDYSDDVNASHTVDYRYHKVGGRTTKKNAKKCDLFLSDGDNAGNVMLSDCMNVMAIGGGDDSVTSSGCSTPTPTSSTGVDSTSRTLRERYDYEIDPDIGVIV